jgi:hypothetical protein
MMEERAYRFFPDDPGDRSEQNEVLRWKLTEAFKGVYNEALEEAARVTDEKMRLFGSTDGYFIRQLKK